MLGKLRRWLQSLYGEIETDIKKTELVVSRVAESDQGKCDFPGCGKEATTTYRRNEGDGEGKVLLRSCGEHIEWSAAKFLLLLSDETKQ